MAKKIVAIVGTYRKGKVTDSAVDETRRGAASRGVETEKIYNRPRAGDIKDSLADISSAREMLGYEPKFDLNSGLRETIKWFQKN